MKYRSNVYPTMALLAYDFKRKTKDMIWNAEYIFIDSDEESRKHCQIDMLLFTIACRYLRQAG
jgi:hypothetical protein